MTRYPFFIEGSYTFFTKEAIQHGEMDYPKMLNIEPTNECNFNCVMCSRRLASRPVGRMSMDLFKAIVEDVVRCKERITWLTLHNDGEPLLHPDLVEMIRVAKSSGVVEYVHFNTNGQLLTEDLAVSLIKAGLDDITVSIDAFTPRTFRKVKRAGCLEIVTNNTLGLMKLKNLLGRTNPWVRVKIIDMALTRGELSDFQNFWRSRVDEVQVQPMHNAAGNLSNEQRSALPGRYPCSLLWYALAINWDGTVSPCCVDLSGENVIGDLNQEILMDIFSHGKIATYREKMVRGQERDLRPCGGCNVWRNGVNLFKDDMASSSAV